MATAPEREDPHDAAAEAYLTTAIAVLFALWAFERIFTMTYVLNFSDRGPDITLLLIALSANGLVYTTPLARTWPHDRRTLDLAFAALVITTILAHVLAPGPSLFFALFALGSVTPLIATAMARQGRDVVFGIALGLLAHVTLRAWNAGLPLAANPIGRVFGALSIVLAIVIWVVRERHLFPTAPDPGQRPRLALIMTFLLLQVALLVHPAAIARWVGEPVWGITVASAAGIAVGAGVNLLPPLPAWLRWTPVLLLTGGISWILFGIGSVAMAAFLAQVGALRLIARANGIPPGGTIAGIGLATGMVQLGGILIVFLHAAGPSWAFLPAPFDALTRGLSAFWFFVLAAFTAIVATPGLIADDQEVPA